MGRPRRQQSFHAWLYLLSSLHVVYRPLTGAISSPSSRPEMALQPANGLSDPPQRPAFYVSFSSQTLSLTLTQPVDSRPEAKCFSHDCTTAAGISSSHRSVSPPGTCQGFWTLARLTSCARPFFAGGRAVHCRLFTRIPG